jgi:spore photoproduct lyase
MGTRFERIILERKTQGDPLTSRILERLPGAETVVVDDAGSWLEDGRAASGTLVLRHHEGRFVKDFPESPGTPPCGEKYIAAVVNCPFACTYCYLQSYLGHSVIAVNVNSARMKEEIAGASADGGVSRITTGELGDSLAIDHITGLTKEILPLLAGSDTILEVRTKGTNVDHLLDARDAGEMGNLAVTWTLTPEKAIESEEPLTATLEERLSALSRVSRAGIRTGIRLDPIIPFYWSRDSYSNLLEMIGEISGPGPERVELGILRFPPGLIERIRASNPYSPLLQGEFVRGRDGKMRLYRPERIRIYRETAALIRSILPGAAIELSMEDVSVWEDAGIDPACSIR